jgi:hypothetical protein
MEHFYIFACIAFLCMLSCNDSYAGGCFSYLSTGLWISVWVSLLKGTFSTTHFMPPAGLEMRPVNVANAPTYGQTGRKEAAKKKREFSGTPRTPAKDCVLCTPELFVSTASEEGKGISGPALASQRCAAQNPGKGLCPLHSC